MVGVSDDEGLRARSRECSTISTTFHVKRGGQVAAPFASQRDHYGAYHRIARLQRRLRKARFT